MPAPLPTGCDANAWNSYDTRADFVICGTIGKVKRGGLTMRSTVAGLAILMVMAAPAAYAGTTQYACKASVGVPPTDRSEGLTELAADLLLTCTGRVPATGITTN